MGQPTKKPDELRATALAMFDKKVVRLEDTARDLAKVLDHVVGKIKRELFDGMAYKDDAPLDDKIVKTLKEVTAAFNSATDAQVRLDKTAKDRAKSMTHEDRKTAVADFILTLPVKERAEWIVELVRRHDELKNLGGGGRPLAGMPSVASAKADAKE